MHAERDGRIQRRQRNKLCLNVWLHDDLQHLLKRCKKLALLMFILQSQVAAEAAFIANIRAMPKASGNDSPNEVQG